MRRIGVIGLGYVGLPVAVAFARRFPGTVGFDRDPRRVGELRAGRDRTGAVDGGALAASGLHVTDDAGELAPCDLYVVAVPTPIDATHRPDLSALRAASATVGGVLAPGDVVVFESTVYPGVTEEVCGPLLEEASGLRAGRDFRLAYSPERINPGDAEHTLERTVKIVGANDDETRALVAECYRAIVPAGVHEASSIQVAEAAKVIENVQRDLNIALMNELSILFDKLGLPTDEVLGAAATKWNFHRYHPGLVGGHCIGVDPYYLTTRAESVGLRPEVILAGRRVNDGMGRFVAGKTVKLLLAAKRHVRGARAVVLGLTFKAGVPDIRNSRVPDVVAELADYGVETVCHDPLADPDEVVREYGIELVPQEGLGSPDALLLLTPHAELRGTVERLLARRPPPAVFVDALGATSRADVPVGTTYWRL